MSTSVPDLASIVPAPAPVPAATDAGSAGTAGGAPGGFATALKAASTATGGAAAPATSGGSSRGANIPPSRPSGEQLQVIAGAPYAKIESGVDAGQYLNEAAGNPRQGEAFQLEHRNGRTLHVYGSGTDEIIEVIHPRTATTTTGATGTSATGTSATGTSATGTAPPAPAPPAQRARRAPALRRARAQPAATRRVRPRPTPPASRVPQPPRLRRPTTRPLPRAADAGPPCWAAPARRTVPPAATPSRAARRDPGRCDRGFGHLTATTAVK